MSKKKRAPGNFVFQDLKRKNGLKSTRGAEKAKRQAKIKRNERWRKANGIVTKGQAARRAKLAKEMLFERSLAESAFDEDAEYPVFSPGVDREALNAILRGEGEPASAEQAASRLPETGMAAPVVGNLSVLQREFGHANFRAGQETAVEAVLGGARTLVVLPTGAGKSLCYQMPARVLRGEGMTLVVSPLIALMSDQLKQLPKCLRGAALHSEMSQTQFNQALTAVKHDLIDVVFASPERLLMFNFQELFKHKLALVCVDEAHCLSEWSHSFRPSYLRLRQVIDVELKAPRVLALTATASLNTVQELVELLKVNTVVREDGISQPAPGPTLAAGAAAAGPAAAGAAAPGCISKAVVRANLAVTATSSVHPLLDLMELLGQNVWRAKRSLIVYVPYQWQTEQTARVLSQQGLGPAEPYHAGLLSADRAAVQRRFMENSTRVVVATVAFSMGIDKADVQGVLHLEMPRSVEQFVQETGRAGRDGRQAQCHCLFSEEEYGRMRRIIFSSAVDKRGLLMLLTWLIAKDEKWRSSGGTLDDFVELDEDVGHVTSLEINNCTRRLNCTSEQLEGIITTVEKNSGNAVHAFLNFPRVVKLRFFRRTLEELAEEGDGGHRFFKTLLNSPVGKDGAQVNPNSGVYTVDVLKAALALKINPPTFMRSLTEHARDSFAVEKREWAHFVYVSSRVSGGSLIAKLLQAVTQTAAKFQNEQLRKIDSIYAIVNRVSLSPEDPTLPHQLVQRYFQGASVEELRGDNELIQQGIARASGFAAGTADHDAAYPWIRSEVIDLMKELVTDSATSIAKFLHALPSPNFATRDWKTHRAWGAWTSLPFDVLLSHVTAAVNEVISRN